MSDTEKTEPSAVPKPESTVLVEGDFTEIEAWTRYRGKTNGYYKEWEAILAIVDACGREIAGRWENDWTAVAPGIETRRERQGTTWTIGDRRHEHWVLARVRIHRSALPVLVHWQRGWAYEDYDDSQYADRGGSDFWVRYEAGSVASADASPRPEEEEP